MPHYTPEEVISLELTANQQDFIWASGHYLTECFPEEYITWDQSKVYKWIETCKWEPFEYHSVEDIYELIEHLSLSVRRYINNA